MLFRCAVDPQVVHAEVRMRRVGHADRRRRAGQLLDDDQVLEEAEAGAAVALRPRSARGPRGPHARPQPPGEGIVAVDLMGVRSDLAVGEGADVSRSSSMPMRSPMRLHATPPIRFAWPRRPGDRSMVARDDRGRRDERIGSGVPRLTTHVDPSSDAFSANEAAMRALVEDLERRLAEAQLGGGETATERHRSRASSRFANASIDWSTGARHSSSSRRSPRATCTREKRRARAS